jgi:DNA-binding MarR family transcriptional regulator
VSLRSRPPDATADHRCIPRDSVDRLLADWRRVRPDLDVSPVGIVSRLERVRGHIELELERVFTEHQLSGPNFAVLVTLGRLNEPGGIPQRRLMDELGLTSGTVSVRIDRLLEQGLVERRPDPDDKRNTRITLTPRGRALFERVAPAHLDNERRLLAGLSDAERELLAALLRKLLVEYEGSLPPRDAPVRLGMTLAPAHVSMAMRRAVGLAPVIGLLVRGVTEGSAADAAGLRQGDVLVRAGRYELRSVAALYTALDEATARGRLRVALVRGTAHHTAHLALPGVGDASAFVAAETAGRAGRDEHLV